MIFPNFSFLFPYKVQILDLNKGAAFKQLLKMYFSIGSWENDRRLFKAWTKLLRGSCCEKIIKWLFQLNLGYRYHHESCLRLKNKSFWYYFIFNSILRCIELTQSSLWKHFSCTPGRLHDFYFCGHTRAFWLSSMSSKGFLSISSWRYLFIKEIKTKIFKWKIVFLFIRSFSIQNYQKETNV